MTVRIEFTDGATQFIEGIVHSVDEDQGVLIVAEYKPMGEPAPRWRYPLVNVRRWSE